MQSKISYHIVVRAPFLPVPVMRLGHWSIVDETDSLVEAGNCFERLSRLFGRRGEVYVLARDTMMPGLQKCIGMHGSSKPPLISNADKLSLEDKTEFWKGLELVEDWAPEPSRPASARTVSRGLDPKTERRIALGATAIFAVLMIPPFFLIFLQIGSYWMKRFAS